MVATTGLIESLSEQVQQPTQELKLLPERETLRLAGGIAHVTRLNQPGRSAGRALQIFVAECLLEREQAEAEAQELQA